MARSCLDAPCGRCRCHADACMLRGAPPWRALRTDARAHAWCRAAPLTGREDHPAHQRGGRHSPDALGQAGEDRLAPGVTSCPAAAPMRLPAGCSMRGTAVAVRARPCRAATPEQLCINPRRCHTHPRCSRSTDACRRRTAHPWSSPALCGRASTSSSLQRATPRPPTGERPGRPCAAAALFCGRPPLRLSMPPALRWSWRPQTLPALRRRWRAR
jgi:hypothetical protein